MRSYNYLRLCFRSMFVYTRNQYHFSVSYTLSLMHDFRRNVETIDDSAPCHINLPYNLSIDIRSTAIFALYLHFVCCITELFKILNSITALIYLSRSEIISCANRLNSSHCFRFLINILFQSIIQVLLELQCSIPNLEINEIHDLVMDANEYIILSRL